MSYHQIDMLLALGMAVVILTTFWYVFLRPLDTVSLDGVPEAGNDEPSLPLAKPVAATLVEKQSDPQEPAPLIARYLSDKCTLLVRHRPDRKCCTAHMIIWAGSKKKLRDSYYDLAVLEDVEPTDAVLDQCMALAKAKVKELAEAGKQKREAAKLARLHAQAAVSVVEPQPTETVTESSSVTVEDTPPETVKLRTFPSVSRGIITEIGMMMQSKDGKEFETYGVRFRTPNGIEDAVYGANLRLALQAAHAEVGDSVEILKIGRKTIDPNKAPMNLFQVKKLQELH